jgi:hypothetical protein
MRYEEIKDVSDKDFKRLTGVRRETFVKMLTIVNQGLRDFGRPAKLSRADQLLLTLMYWREYRTQFHIAQTYGISEATVCRTIRRIEDVLIQSGELRLPGKKQLHPNQAAIQVIVVDATEQPIERPKKSSVGTTAGRRSAIPRRLK